MNARQMSPGTTYEAHPYANEFPMMSDAELGDLAAKIKATRQEVPIVLDQHERVVDGRNRLAACRRAGVGPIVEKRIFKTDRDVLDYVTAMNLARRHLSATQRAIIADRLANLKDGQHKSGMPTGIPDTETPLFVPSVSLDEAAEKLKVSRRHTARARRVRLNAIPEIQEMVAHEELTILPADEVAAMPEEEQRAMAALGAEEITRRQAAKRNEAKRRGGAAVAEVEPSPANGEATKEEEEEETAGPGRPKRTPVGVIRAHEAINCLSRIPKNDPQRERGFQIVKDWLRHNR